MGREAKGSNLIYICLLKVLICYTQYCRIILGLYQVFSLNALSVLANKSLRGKSLNSVLYDAWSRCDEGVWDRSTFLKQVRDRHRSTNRGTRKWLTAKQMDDIFGPEAAQQMRNRKLFDEELRSKEVRAHPDAPDCQDMVTHVCLFQTQPEYL